MNDFDDLLGRVAAEAAKSERLQAPLTALQLTAAENRLGFRLHPHLAALYRQVGNGGFGPEESLLSLTPAPGSDDETTVVESYLDRLPPADADTWWSWPRGVVPVLDWGCAMVAAVDCLSEDAAVLLFEPNAIRDQDLSGAWFVDAGSLAEWLEVWLSGTGWYEDGAVAGVFGMPLWADAASRLQSKAHPGAPA
ncbi:SMI1/KNR4 family protein [Streptomyces sp. NBC_01218]|uniref:SMI1/KNR4 family protein n=2 Tax=unclassified Streptomyces TaxID=2593676 RepID=UPI002E13FEE1|nr:SMI1/KNR4 family protein [Streptomyces sp. NBC_01218]